MEFTRKKLITTQPQSVECPYCGETESYITQHKFISSPFSDILFGLAAICECDSCHREWLIHTLTSGGIAEVYLTKEEVE